MGWGIKKQTFHIINILFSIGLKRAVALPMPELAPVMRTVFYFFIINIQSIIKKLFFTIDKYQTTIILRSYNYKYNLRRYTWMQNTTTTQMVKRY